MLRLCRQKHGSTPDREQDTDLKGYCMSLISNEVSTNPLFPAPHQNTKFENAMKILQHQKVPKLLEMHTCNSRSLHLFRYPTSFYSNCQMAAFWEHGIPQPQALLPSSTEYGTGILIKFNHNSHNDKNIPILPRMLCWTEKRAVQRME